MTLERRTPLKRGKGLARGDSKLKRTRIKPMSDKRRADIPRRQQVKAEVHRRDGYRCQLQGVPGAGACFGPLEMHERRKASQLRDSYTVENGTTLCSSHNGRLESDADLAKLGEAMGLVIRAG